MAHYRDVSHLPLRLVLILVIGAAGVVACTTSRQGTVRPPPLASTAAAPSATTTTPLPVIRDPALVDIASQSGKSSTAFSIQLPRAGQLTVSFACAGRGSAVIEVQNLSDTVPCSGNATTDQFALGAGQFTVRVKAKSDQHWRLLLQRPR
jgi:hypothetical protein